MATIEQLKKEGQIIYPVTTPKAVRDESGNTVQSMIEAAALVNVIETSIPETGLKPNIEYDLGELSGTLTIPLETPAEPTKSNVYFFTFETGATAPSITWPSVEWQSGNAPTINANKHYEITIRKGYGYVTEFNIKSV